MGEGKIRRPVIGGKLHINGRQQAPAEFIFELIRVAVKGIYLIGLQYFGQPNVILASSFVG